MPTLSPKDNLLRLIKHNDPEYLPYGLEGVVNVFHEQALFYQGNGDPTATAWTDAWGVKFAAMNSGKGGSAYPVAHPMTDLASVDSFGFPDPWQPGLLDRATKLLQQVDRTRQLVMAVNPGVMFVRSWLLRGMENLLMDVLLEPDLVAKLLDRIAEYQLVIARRYLELKPDMVRLADDAGTTKALMIRPALWRTLVKPRLRKLVAAYKDAGCIIYFHCCGCVMDILDDIMDMGVDILNPLQAGANDLRLLRQKTQGRLVLCGGIDAHTVATADPGTVARLAAETIDILGDGGFYIPQPDQGLPFPRENVEAIKSVIQKRNWK
jgi:uroporphyrinogen decarboxylase